MTALRIYRLYSDIIYGHYHHSIGLTLASHAFWALLFFFHFYRSSVYMNGIRMLLKMLY